jgi:hypothetical protein
VHVRLLRSESAAERGGSLHEGRAPGLDSAALSEAVASARSQALRSGGARLDLPGELRAELAPSAWRAGQIVGAVRFGARRATAAVKLVLCNRAPVKASSTTRAARER